MEVSYFYYQISILMMTKEHKIFNDLDAVNHTKIRVM